MRNVLGNHLTLTVFGESHQEMIGATLDGVTPGIKVDEEDIKYHLSLRRPSGSGETQRVESDDFSIVSGVFNGYTTGAPLTIIIKNNEMKSKDYQQVSQVARPSQSDYVAHEKYHGYNDYRGGGHFSGRIFAPVVAVCSILKSALKEKFDIDVVSHIKSIGNISDDSFESKEDALKIKNNAFPLLDSSKEELMKEEIDKVAQEGDSIGGSIETMVTNLPVGVGEPLFSSLEGEISKAMFAIGGVKAISFGKGSEISSLKGSEANDPFRNVDGKVVTTSNNNGGINAGISNGMEVLFTISLKPTASIYKKQESVSLDTYENTELELTGRHDPCYVRRVAVISSCLTAFVISDLLMVKYGSDLFLKEKLD